MAASTCRFRYRLESVEIDPVAAADRQCGAEIRTLIMPLRHSLVDFLSTGERGNAEAPGEMVSGVHRMCLGLSPAHARQIRPHQEVAYHRIVLFVVHVSIPLCSLMVVSHFEIP